MALTIRQKQNIKKEYGIHEEDTGSAEIQIAFLTKQIIELTAHLKSNPKDNHSRRGLLKMVGKRKKLLDYLGKNNEKSYTSIVRKLGLKK
ncbi:MAG: 30S ribosomal protein S15 [Patescibacteria group bacterium]